MLVIDVLSCATSVVNAMMSPFELQELDKLMKWCFIIYGSETSIRLWTLFVLSKLKYLEFQLDT